MNSIFPSSLKFPPISHFPTAPIYWLFHLSLCSKHLEYCTCTFTDWIWFIPKRCFPILASPAPPARWLGSWRRRGCTWWWCGACPTTSTSTTPTLPSASYSSPPSSQGTCFHTGILYIILYHSCDRPMRDQILGHCKTFAKSFSTLWSKSAVLSWQNNS